MAGDCARGYSEISESLKGVHKENTGKVRVKMIKLNISYETQEEYREVKRRFLTLLPEGTQIRETGRKGRYYHVYVSCDAGKKKA